MVKGISRQVIVVHSPEPKLFEQAIFILKEDAQEVTDEQLLKEANRALHSAQCFAGWEACQAAAQRAGVGLRRCGADGTCVAAVCHSLTCQGERIVI